MKYLKELIEEIEILETLNFNNNLIKGITNNSLEIKKDFLFCALRGTSTDGNLFIPQAIYNGASTILTDVFPKTIHSGITYLIVDDARKAMALISKKFYDYNRLKSKIIGVTGTNGKTTITFLISSLLKNLGYTTAVIGTTGIYLNNDKLPTTHTTPESVRLYEIFDKINSFGIDYIIMEVSSHSLVQKRVYGVEFDLAIFTNLTPDHLDYHETMDNYAKAKKILFDSLKPSAISIINSDDAYSDFIVSNLPANQIVRVGTNTNSDYILKPIKSSIKGVEFNLLHPKSNQTYYIQANLIGEFNIWNLALALVATSFLGNDLSKLVEFTDKLIAAPGRMEIIKLKNDAIGVVDYAHTPDALEKVIKTLNNLKNGGKLITVFGCGGDRDKSKRPLMGCIASVLSDKVIITNDNPRTENPDNIIQEILQGVDKAFFHKIDIIPDRRLAIQTAINKSTKGDIVLVAGKGHEKYQIFGNEKIHFDDIEELKKFV